MTGAMNAAIAGLRAHMDKMNVIGNNIANVNTNGYKSQRAIFKDAMYSMYSAGSNGSAINGGKNPSQIGYGSQISSIDLDMRTGSYTLGRATDCMIYGDGFFLVGDKTVAENIENDEDKLSVMKGGLELTRVGDFEFKADGFLCDGSGRPVYGFMSVADDKVSNKLAAIQLPKLSEDGKTIIYPGQEGITPEEYEKLPFVQMDSISINKDTGAITGTCKDLDKLITIGYLAIGNVTNPSGISHTEGFYYKCGDGAGDLQISVLGKAAEDLWPDEKDRMVNGSDDPMLRIGDAGGTNLMTGGLEGSNVDLANEISEMITTQRGYQANTRIITVTDSMLEELVNIKR